MVHVLDGTRANSHDLTALSGSVFSAASWIFDVTKFIDGADLGEVCCARAPARAVGIVVGSYSIKVVAFFGFHVYQLSMDEADRHEVCFARALAELCLLIFKIAVMMVLIDRASKDLSNGGLFVDFGTSNCENLAATSDLADCRDGHFLTPLLTESIELRVVK